MVSNEAWYGGDAGGARSLGTPSAVSWAAIFAGAAAAAALSLILLLLGAGLGLSATSPWAGEGMGAAAMGVTGIVWLAFTQIAASGLGGYLAGRLRVRWRDTAADEVHFRDTAHGLLTWAVATLATAAVLSASVAGIAKIGTQAAAVVAGGTAAAAGAVTTGMPSKEGAGLGTSSSTGAGDFADLGYFVDGMLRRDPAATGATGNASTAPAASNGNAVAPNPDTLRAAPDVATGATASELGRLVARALRQDGVLSPEDTRQAGAIVSQRTGLSQAEAEKRVTDGLTRARTELQAAQAKAREAADAARKAALQTALWMFVALLIGAFSASWFATVGGRQRDRVE
ncbi:hypothetical protein [Roseateles amylovorans]|uniref:Transmembrane protein n=1 Tax=Roseateles amylovorans TaxID=2978473 RepID=A0ABY6B3R9_9BURK|nr:hypothetical protein [Roseateles amylovorans]UXH79707.1 hypothetical protein N4261_07295 [Roseateles amylovorans]